MSEITVSEHFTIKKLLRFTVPTMIMMMLYTTYIVIDGVFISNFAGPTEYAAVNIAGNYLYFFAAIGTMLGSGCTALISKTTGEKNNELASEQFSTVLWFSIIFGIILMLTGYFTVGAVAKLQGAEGELLEACLLYGHIGAISMMFYIIQSEFRFFFPMVEKERLGLVIAGISGIINIVFDAVFIIAFGWGLFGAALASLLGTAFGGIFPVVYFYRNKELMVRIQRPVFSAGTMVKVCTNGLSELVTNLSIALIGMLFNYQMMRYAGENGVAAYGVIQAVTLVFLAVYDGYCAGIISVAGYHFGAENHKELKSLFKKSLIILSVFNILLFGITEAFAGVFAGIFVGYDRELLDMTVRGMRIYGSVFLLTSFNVFGSAFFIALNDGLSAAVISFARTVVFLAASVIILPLFRGLDGIWLANPVAEILAVTVTLSIVLINGKKYSYI